MFLGMIIIYMYPHIHVLRPPPPCVVVQEGKCERLAVGVCGCVKLWFLDKFYGVLIMFGGGQTGFILRKAQCK